MGSKYRDRWNIIALFVLFALLAALYVYASEDEETGIIPFWGMAAISIVWGILSSRGLSLLKGLISFTDVQKRDNFLYVMFGIILLATVFTTILPIIEADNACIVVFKTVSIPLRYLFYVELFAFPFLCDFYLQALKNGESHFYLLFLELLLFALVFSVPFFSSSEILSARSIMMIASTLTAGTERWARKKRRKPYYTWIYIIPAFILALYWFFQCYIESRRAFHSSVVMDSANHHRDIPLLCAFIVLNSILMLIMNRLVRKYIRKPQKLFVLYRVLTVDFIFRTGAEIALILFDLPFLETVPFGGEFWFDCFLFTFLMRGIFISINLPAWKTRKEYGFPVPQEDGRYRLNIFGSGRAELAGKDKAVRGTLDEILIVGEDGEDDYLCPCFCIKKGCYKIVMPLHSAETVSCDAVSSVMVDRLRDDEIEQITDLIINMDSELDMEWIYYNKRHAFDALL